MSVCVCVLARAESSELSGKVEEDTDNEGERQG